MWSVMRQLALWQLERGYRVGFGLLISKRWPASYREQVAEMRSAGIEIMTAPSPDLFGTGAILYHQFMNPISQWAKTFCGKDEPTVVHFHNAWLSGADTCRLGHRVSRPLLHTTNPGRTPPSRSTSETASP